MKTDNLKELYDRAGCQFQRVYDLDPANPDKGIGQERGYSAKNLKTDLKREYDNDG